MPVVRGSAFAFLLLVVIPAAIVAQSSPATVAAGRIVGRVVDAATGAPIPGAQVRVEGAVGGVAVAAVTEWSGRFTLADVPAGTRAVAARMIGYRAKTVADVVVRAGAVTQIDVTLDPAAVELEGVVVSAEAERGSVSRALEEQRTASQIVNAVTAEQISRSPDADAGQAIQRVSGVTVQDGKYVFVRGLGERYTTTTLNGARLPSPEPDRKVVPLDLLPSGLLEGITTYKTFTPDRQGDMSGAQVNLKTRDVLLNVFTLSASASYNDAIMRAPMLRAPTAGSEWLGIAAPARDIPAAARDAGTLQGLTQSDLNRIIGSFRNAWTGLEEDGGANGSTRASLGARHTVLGRPVDLLATATYSYAQEGRLDERRALAAPGSTPGTWDVQNAYRGLTGRTSVLWGGLFNLGTPVGDAGRIAFNNTFTHSGDNEATRLAGLNNGLAETLEITRLTFTERGVRSHQLTGQHLLAGRHTFDWSATAARVTRREPDRSDLVYQTTIDPLTGVSRPYAWYGASRSATRTFSDVLEDGYEGGVNYRHALGSHTRPAAVKVGAYARWTDRDADTRAYDVLNIGLTETERRQAAEAIFNGTYAQEGRLFLAANAALGRYGAADRLVAGYAQAEVPLGDHVRLIGGARVERAHLEVTSTTIELGDTTTVLANTDVLPSLAVQVRLGEAQNLRLSASQTLSRPEYRELSPVPYFDVLGGQSLIGYPALERALIRNVDARWEWYPDAGQVIGLALFAKQFERPIERILVQRSDGNEPAATFRNSRSAKNYGVEVELRRNLSVVVPALLPFTVFSNVTWMQSEIRPSADRLSSLTNARRPMVGQAEYVVNAGLNYTGAGRASATLLYNLVGPRIVEAAIFPLPDVYELERHVIDVSVQLPLAAGTTIKLDAKNLLDSPYRWTQGTVERLHYRTGRVFSAGVSWEP